MNSLTIKGLFSYIVTGGGTHPQILRGYKQDVRQRIIQSRQVAAGLKQQCRFPLFVVEIVVTAS